MEFLEPIKGLVAHIKPGFRCHPSGIDNGARAVVAVRNQMEAPMRRSADALAAIPDGLRPLYEQTNAVLLYAPVSPKVQRDSEGILLHPPENIRKLTRMMKEMSDASHHEDADQFGFACFGEVLGSGNYFAIATKGHTAGQVYYLNHDPGPGDDADGLFAPNLAAFLEALTTKPATLLTERLGPYTRYSDGRTKTQWIPKEYFPDTTNAGVSR